MLGWPKILLTVSDRLATRQTPEGSAGTLLAAMAARMVVSLGLTMLLGRHLSAAEFGFFALVTTVFSLGYELTDMGGGNLAVRDTAGARHSERCSLENLLGWRLRLSAIAAAGCLGLALAQHSIAHQLILTATAPILVFAYNGAFHTVFQLRQAQLAPALAGVVLQLGTLAAALLLFGLNVAGALLALLVLARELATLFVNRRLALHLLDYVPRPRLRRRAAGPFFGSASIVAAATLCYHAQSQGGMLLVQMFRPQAELGAFAAVLRPMTPLLLVPWVLMLPLVPLLAWLAVARPDDFRRQVRSTLQLAIGIGAIIAVAAYRLAPAALQFLYGGRFSDGLLDATVAWRWMALPLGCSFSIAVFAAALLALHREKHLLALSAGSLVVYVVSSLGLLSEYRFTASAVAVALSISCLTIGGLVAVAQAPNGCTPGWRALLFLVPAALLFVVLDHLPGSPVFQLSTAGLLTSVALLALWRLPGVAEHRAEQVRLSDLAQTGLAPIGAALGATSKTDA